MHPWLRAQVPGRAPAGPDRHGHAPSPARRGGPAWHAVVSHVSKLLQPAKPQVLHVIVAALSVLCDAVCGGNLETGGCSAAEVRGTTQERRTLLLVNAVPAHLSCNRYAVERKKKVDTCCEEIAKSIVQEYTDRVGTSKRVWRLQVMGCARFGRVLAGLCRGLSLGETLNNPSPPDACSLASSTASRETSARMWRKSWRASWRNCSFPCLAAGGASGGRSSAGGCAVGGD